VNIFFDVDGTLISFLDQSLRPGVREVFEQIVRDGHRIYIWSGVGIRRQEIDRHSLRQYVTDCCLKPLSDHRASLVQLGVPAEPHFVVDDYPEVVDSFAGHAIRPYERRDPQDREMEVVYKKIVEMTTLRGI
jgi:predicted HAD superfamily phosphohydrolase YqeG